MTSDLSDFKRPDRSRKRGECGKFCYPTRLHAERALNKIRVIDEFEKSRGVTSRSDEGSIEKSVYHCNECDAFHLTSSTVKLNEKGRAAKKRNERLRETNKKLNKERRRFARAMSYDDTMW